MNPQDQIPETQGPPLDQSVNLFIGIRIWTHPSMPVNPPLDLSGNSLWVQPVDLPVASLLDPPLNLPLDSLWILPCTFHWIHP